MIRLTALLGAAAVLSASCTTASEPTPPPTSGGAAACDAAKAQFAVGRAYSDALAEEARTAAGAARVRKLEPGKAYTMEFDERRLNLEVSASETVTAARCG